MVGALTPFLTAESRRLHRPRCGRVQLGGDTVHEATQLGEHEVVRLVARGPTVVVGDDAPPLKDDLL